MPLSMRDLVRTPPVSDQRVWYVVRPSICPPSDVSTRWVVVVVLVV